jgi:hypothetical protein
MVLHSHRVPADAMVIWHWMGVGFGAVENTLNN